MIALKTYTSYGRGAGSARVRVFDWIDYLSLDAASETYLGTSNNSLRTLANSPVSVVRAESRLRKATREISRDTVLISRQASPFSNGRIEEMILEKSARGVYDFDDALVHSPTRGASSIWSKRRVWSRAVGAADVVIAGNSYLADQASSLSDNVVVIPSCVNPTEYERKISYDIGDVPRAVWMGSPSSEHYLATISDALLAMHASSGLRLTVVSAGEAELGALDVMTDRRDWTPHGFGQELRQADFGVMPLIDSEWARGKCAYKLLQYGAAGLPILGSPVGANSAVLSRADAGAPSTTDEWVFEMETLLNDSPASRAARGERAYRTVVDEYSFSAWSSAWTEAVGVTAHLT